MDYTTSEKGNIGEAAFRLWCAKNRYICGKADDKASYDFFLDRHDGRILRVQVKYRTPNKDGRIEIKLKPTDSQNNNYFDYTSDSIDAFAVYNSLTDQMALIPISDLPTNQSYFFLLCRDSQKETSTSRLFEHYVV